MAKEAPESSAQVEPGEWVCRNCGSFNVEGTTHCKDCGFAAGFDPEREAALVHPQLPVEFAAEPDMTERLRFYLSIAQLVLLLAIAGFLIPVLLRLHQHWPFQQPYDRDALELASRLMTMQARLEIGVNKQEFESLLANVLGENSKFKAIYGSRPERQRDSYQKLVQASEYYGFANKAWQTQLNGTSQPLSVQAMARSADANKDVKDYWQRAHTNATEALADLH